MSPLDVVVLAATRTPLGSFQGSLASVSAPGLGATAIREAVSRAGVPPDAISDVLMGQVLQAGAGQAPARQAALGAGLAPAVRTRTINKVCGSGMQAIVDATVHLGAGTASVAVAGGMESMSRAPFLLPKAREGFRLGHQQVIDSVITDGLWDPYNDLHMGACAERCASKYGFSRETQDAYARASFERAAAAQQAGLFADEIVSVPVVAGTVSLTVTHDEGPGKANFTKMASLRPAFAPTGTITAANASTLNDGAAAVILTSSALATRLGVAPIARIVAFGAHAHEPLWFTTAPLQAANAAISAAGWSRDDVDLWEINEAFAVVPLAFMTETGIPMDRVNVRGGAIALGHPIGCSGARIVVTLLSALRERGLRRGVAAICIGGGEALALCLELT